MRILAIVVGLTTVVGLARAVWLENASDRDPLRLYKKAHVRLAPPANDTLIWPIQDNINPTENNTGIDLPLPENIEYNVTYDPATGDYNVSQSVGGLFDYRPGTVMSLDDYLGYDLSEQISRYWQEKQAEEDAANRGFAPIIKVGGEGFANIFGSNEIEIRPQGTAELTFGINYSRTDNPRIPERQRRITVFDFDQRIQLNVVGNIGTKLKLTTSYNTQANFDFENQMKLEYTGEEDEIIKKIEAGNVSFPLPGTLITGSQSLFGGKIETQFGRLRNTTVFSQQRGEKREIQVSNGAQTQIFEVSADNYEANKHFFLSQYFRDSYDQAMNSLPVVASGVNITRIEVWVVNLQANTQDVRNVIGFSDLGEHPDYLSPEMNPGQLTNNATTQVTIPRYPNNLQNDIFQDMIGNPQIMAFTGASGLISALPDGYQQEIHYSVAGNARKLTPSEFTYNSRLGFISLNQALNNNEQLAVAYEYTVQGETYQVGTLSTDGFTAPGALILKMLKSRIVNVKSPMWDLMMKNVYSLGAFGISRDNFRLDIWYNNPATGIDMNYIPRQPIDGKRLLTVMNLDKLDFNNFPYEDGLFDWVDNASTTGGTINATNGRLFFPVIEPFGSHLADVITEGVPNPVEAQNIINQIVFQPLYDSTKTAAQQIPTLNRFRIKGQYQSSSGSEISLNAFNVPQGSVTVTAGGTLLTENVDYTVDYNLGKVRILNQGLLESGTPISISLESNSMFALQLRTMIGSRFDYTISKDFKVGATILNLKERPITQKVNIGDEPVNNTIVGTDLSYRTDSDFLTRVVDKIPLIETKAKSTIDVSGEAAYFIPGHSKAISKSGNAYLDDFEGSQSLIDIRALNQWYVASTPKLQSGLFPEGALEDSLAFRYNVAKLAWYNIDPLFFLDNQGIDGIDVEVRSDHRMREVLESEVFPNRQLPAGTPPNIATLDLSYYPNERGMYNYDPVDGTNISSGLNPDGTLAEPETRWAGIMRPLTTTDFEQSNIEFIQFWVMDPFNEDSENINGGDLYFNIGNISEDVMNDTYLSFENGFPSANQNFETIQGNWGFYPDPSIYNVVNAFDATTPDYSAQDIGLDGLNSNSELQFFSGYLTELQNFLNPDALSQFTTDISGDDYQYFRRDGNLNTLERYKDFNGYEGNSNTAVVNGISQAATTIPNTEDINQNLTLDNFEAYFQYKVSLRPGDLGPGSIGTNFITDRVEVTKNTANGENRPIVWYQFKIPVREFSQKFGGIGDFRSIGFLRMFLKGWSEPVTLRFARLELVRGEWRKYLDSLEAPGEYEPTDNDETIFNIAAVNIEENGNRSPVPYVIPLGIQREVDVATANLRNLNEQSLSMEICNLRDGDARAAYRNVNFDMRMYGKVEMLTHAESLGATDDLNDNDLSCFLRMGSDFNDNYYEYEIPLKKTPWGTSDPNIIWPAENEMVIELSVLQNLKQNRPAGFPNNLEFEQTDGAARVKVKGNPNLASVQVIMVGVRNPQQNDNPWAQDDGSSKCAYVWVNELRMTDFNQKGGWAAVARMNAQLADFASVALSGNISTPGWGTLEQRIQERQQENIKGWDASSTVQLGKFFPEDAGVKIPMYVGYSETFTNPRFDPLVPDIEFDDIARNLTPEEKRERRQRTQGYVRRRSINLTDVRIAPTGKGKGEGKPKDEKVEEKPSGRDAKPAGPGGAGGADAKFYSVSNFAVSYSYSDIFKSDINTELDFQRMYRGGLNYSFNNNPKEIKPFQNIGFVKDSKYLKFVKEFNFFTGLKSVGFRTEMNRTYHTMKLRDNNELLFGVPSISIIPTTAMKTWGWTRDYNVKYDITKSLKADFNAINNALVGEPPGLIDKTDSEGYQAYKDTVWNNITNFGETTRYQHQANLNYKLPLDKFPLIDFVSSDARYGSSYQWDRAPFSQDTLGATIQNSRNLTLNAQANLDKLYNKVGYLKKINQPPPPAAKKPAPKDAYGKEVEEEDKKKDKKPINPLHEFLKVAMSLKSVSGTYARNEGMLVPGYNRNTLAMGLDPQLQAPGLGFIFGQQNTDIFGKPRGNFALEAGSNDWLVQQQFLNNQYTETYSEQINLKANLEPIKHFKIEINGTQTESRNLSSFFRWDEMSGEYVFDSPIETGNYSVSINTWKTTFVKDREDNTSETFDAFLNNRVIVSGLLNSEFHNYPTDSLLNNGYYPGWSQTSQDVVIPSFIAAYGGKDVKNSALDVFGNRMQPTWRITYDGLTKIPAIKNKFKQFNINHQYRSTLSASYVTNLNYLEDSNGNPAATDQSDWTNYIPQRQINSVNISEQLAPLIGFDMTLKTKKGNDPQFKIEYKQDRTVTLSMANFQVTETKSNAIVFGVGYTLPEVPNPFYRQRKGSKLAPLMLKNSPLQLRTDLMIRDNVTVIRQMEQNQNQITAGQKVFSVKTSADLNISNKLTLRYFYDHQITSPKVSTSFKTSNINSGITLRFTLTD